jgi:hypothetical protein
MSVTIATMKTMIIIEAFSMVVLLLKMWPQGYHMNHIPITRAGLQ